MHTQPSGTQQASRHITLFSSMPQKVWDHCWSFTTGRASGLELALDCTSSAIYSTTVRAPVEGHKDGRER